MKPPAKGGDMKRDASMDDLAGAWELAWQTRFCPPEELVYGQDQTPEAQAHLRACPYCADLAALRRPPGSGPRTYPAPASPSARPATPPLATGQLWRLAPGLDGWGPKERYYHSPVVLVLETGSQLPNAVLVAQTYHDTLLSGPDDLSLEPRRFAQPWNLYTLHRRDLDHCCGQVDPTLAQRVLVASRGPFAPLEPTSALYLFRQMEIELGCFFASTAVCALLEEARDPAGEVGAGDVSTPLPAVGAGSPEAWGEQPHLRADLLALGLEVPTGEAQAADLYFLAAPPAAELPLAASGTEAERTAPVVAFGHQAGRPRAWHLLEARVTDYVGSPQVMVGGRFSAPLPPGGPWRIEFGWLDRQGGLVRSQAHLVVPGGAPAPRFWAAFPIPEAGAPNLGHRLRIRLFQETDRRS